MNGTNAASREIGRLDLVAAAVVLIAAEVELALLQPAQGLLWWDATLVAVIGLSLAWWRSDPLLCACVSAGSVALLGAGGDATSLIVPMVVLFVPPYAVGCFEPARRAQLGLAICLAGPAILNIATDSDLSSWLFAAGMTGASWATGRVVRNRALHADEVAAKARWLIAEADSRAALAVAEERTRIARQLHRVVAAGVRNMVDQATQAQRWLTADSPRADIAMGAIEAAGHRALAEMRSVLGDLRAGDVPPELEPQPGIGRLGALVDNGGLRIRLRVRGHAGLVPNGVDLAIYRTTEEAIKTIDGGDAIDPVLAVEIVYGERDLTLVLSVDGTVPLLWPTPVMCEWAALAGGHIVVDATTLTATFSRVLEDAFL